MEPKKEFITLSREELCDIDGGIAWVAIGIVVAGAAIFIMDIRILKIQKNNWRSLQ